MARVNDFICDRCGNSIGGMTFPVVVYVVAGIVTRQTELLVPIGALPGDVEAMRDLPEPRKEMCVPCWTEAHLVHPSEVERLLQLALQEQLDLRNDRKVQEIQYKMPALLEQAASRYQAAVTRAAQGLGLLPAPDPE